MKKDIPAIIIFYTLLLGSASWAEDINKLTVNNQLPLGRHKYEQPLSGTNLLYNLKNEKWTLPKYGVTVLPAAGIHKLPCILFNVKKYTHGESSSAVSPLVPGIEGGYWYEFSYYLKIERRDYSAKFLYNLKLTSSKEQSCSEKIIKSSSREELQPADGGKKWIFINKQFYMPEAYDSLQVAFKLVNGAGKLWVTDCRLVRLSGKRERIYPQVPVKSFSKNKSKHKKEKTSLVLVSDKNEGPNLLLNNSKIAPLLHKYCSSPSKDYGNLNDIHNAGIKTHIIPLGYSSKLKHKTFWVANNKFDFSYLDKRISEVLCINSDVNIMLSLNMYPYLTFGNDYPDECWLDADKKRCIRNIKTGKKLWRGETLKNDGDYFCFSFASKHWREGGTQSIKALWKHINNSSYKNSIVGIHLAPAQDGQFFPWTACRSYAVNGIGSMDFSKSQLQYFRNYLRQKYKNNIEKLRQAWNTPSVTFKNASFPSIEQLNQYTTMFRSGQKQVVDCREAMYDVISRVYGEFAEAAKKYAGKPIFLSVYYPDCLIGCANAHFATGKLLESKYIDAVASPAHYGPDRLLGSCGGFENTVNSYPLHNKIHICEWDHRTWLAPVHRDAIHYLGLVKNKNQFADMLRREAGMALAFGYGAWFYEMDPGWYTDPGLIEEIANIESFMTPRNNYAFKDYKPDVAVFVDEKMMGYLSERAASIFNVSTRHVSKAMNLSGVPYNIYLQDDLTNPELPDFKLYIFLNPTVFTSKQKQFIETGLKKNKKTIVWTYAAGCGESTDPGKDISKMTGIKVKLETLKPNQSKALTIQSKDFLASELESYLNVPYSPSFSIFSVSDEQAVPLAKHSYDNSVCTAVKRFADWTSVYVAIPGGFTPQFINNLAQDSEAFTCAKAGDAVYISEGNLVVHSCSDQNPKKINLPGKCAVKDPFSNKVFSENSDCLTIDVPVRESRCFLLNKQNERGAK